MKLIRAQGSNLFSAPLELVADCCADYRTAVASLRYNPGTGGR